jgi:hypothetical protein
MTKKAPSPSEPKIRSFRDDDAAESFCRRRNRCPHERLVDLMVIVEGPEENEWSVMPCVTAIQNGFFYHWVA